MIPELLKRDKFSLEQLRTLKKMSREELAERLEMSVDRYSRAENDSSLLRKWKGERLIKLAEIFGISLDQIDFFY